MLFVSCQQVMEIVVLFVEITVFVYRHANIQRRLWKVSDFPSDPIVDVCKGSY